MRVEPNRVVTICVATEYAGESQPPQTFTFVYGMERLLFDLDRQLYGLAQGEAASIELKPFGERRPELVRQLPAADLVDAPVLVAGSWYECRTAGGELVAFQFLERDGGLLTCDFNHPSAGRTLTVSARVLEVREPTPEELASAGCSSG